MLHVGFTIDLLNYLKVAVDFLTVNKYILVYDTSFIHLTSWFKLNSY